MWEHMKELAEEQSDENSRRKVSQDSSEENVEEALPRVKARLALCYLLLIYLFIIL